MQQIVITISYDSNKTTKVIALLELADIISAAKEQQLKSEQLWEGDNIFFTIANKKMSLITLNEIVAKKWPGLEVAKTYDTIPNYFYLYSEDDDLGLKLAGLWSSSIVGAYNVNDLTLDQWIHEIERVLNDSDRLEGERCPVYPKDSK